MGAQKSALKTLEFLKKLFVLCLTYGCRQMCGVTFGICSPLILENFVQIARKRFAQSCPVNGIPFSFT